METLNARESVGTRMTAGAGLNEIAEIAGHYDMVCTDENGTVLWSDEFDNLVTTIGMNQLLASGVFGSTPAFMGLISSTSFTAVSATDTMASHSGWLEAGTTNAPDYSGTRASLAFGAPSAGATATSSTNTFVFTTSGTVNGGFIAFAPSASGTIMNTGGVLLSAGTIATAQPVIAGNTITMSYTLTL